MPGGNVKEARKWLDACLAGKDVRVAQRFNGEIGDRLIANAYNNFLAATDLDKPINTRLTAAARSASIVFGITAGDPKSKTIIVMAVLQRFADRTKFPNLIAANHDRIVEGLASTSFNPVFKLSETLRTAWERQESRSRHPSMSVSSEQAAKIANTINNNVELPKAKSSEPPSIAAVVSLAHFKAARNVTRAFNSAVSPKPPGGRGA